MALNLHLVRIFVSVAEQKSFSAAAKSLYISQPAVSKGVHKLEEQLGVLLVDRSRRSITLTEAGGHLYEHAQRLFAVESAAERMLEELAGLERGHLAIGAGQTIGTYLLPTLLRRFHELYPGITLSLQNRNARDVIENLRNMLLDIAFVEGPVGDPDLVTVPWKEDRLALITHPQHPLARQDDVTLHDISQHPFLQREPGSGTRAIVEQAFRAHGLQLDVAIELNSNQVVKQAVIAGLGISIVSETTIELERDAGIIRVITPSDHTFVRPLSFVTIKGRRQSRAAMAFLALLGE
jgi:DNA-binding transcriptional LysR family regulator